MKWHPPGQESTDLDQLVISRDSATAHPSIHPSILPLFPDVSGNGAVVSHNVVLSYSKNSQEICAIQRDAFGTNGRINFLSLLWKILVLPPQGSQLILIKY